MDFNKLILDRFALIFQKHNMFVIEQSKNYVKFKSDNIIITISHDDRENTNSFYIGKKENALYQIDENVLKDVFKSALKINYATPEVFANNLAAFFEEEGKLLLAGDADALKKVEKCVYKESEEYTTELADKQNLAAADKAWKEGNFKDFIKYLTKTDMQKLPPSYDMKYKMAQQKLK